MWNTVVVIVGASVTTCAWLSMACKHNSQVWVMKKMSLCALCAKVYEVTGTLSRTVSVVFTKQKCQELISGYTKTHGYSEVYPIVNTIGYTTLNVMT